jgi:hypothetical protein
MLGRIRIFGLKTRLDRRAERISDPVERLRFLRREMAISSVQPQPVRTRNSRALRYAGWLGMFVILPLATAPTPKGAAETMARERGLLVPRADAAVNLPSTVSRVWLVEHSESTEVYSNGLRVDLTFTVSNRPRSRFAMYALTGAYTPIKTGESPVGILYHMNESNLAPFEEEQTRKLKRFGRYALETIRQERAYHYVIDRFGRVFSVVAESDAANHAGNSIWADSEGIYINLNDSFIGVSFEGQTASSDEVTPAQILSARTLTEMLRSRYGIVAENCVTHAQVSVNPLNMHIANHTDWASNFPFSSLGLPDNYAIPLPSLYLFGFEFDDVFLRVMGGRWKGLNLAVEQLERQAAAEHVPVAQYRAMLRHRYKDIAAALKNESEGGS